MVTPPSVVSILMAREAFRGLTDRWDSRSVCAPLCPPPDACGVRCCVVQVIYVPESSPGGRLVGCFLPVWSLFLVLEQVFHRARVRVSEIQFICFFAFYGLCFLYPA